MENLCSICNSKTKTVKHSKTSVLFHECPTCQLITRELSDYFSHQEEVERYLQHQNSIDDSSYQNYFVQFIVETKLLENKDNRIVNGLDFGSGPTPVLAHVLTHNYQVNMDIYDPIFSPNPVYENKLYDFITCTEVIEHIKNPLETFNLFNKLLVPNGLLAIMTQFHPNHENLFLDWFYIRDRSHISFFTLRTVETLAAKTGFTLAWMNQKNCVTLIKNN